MDGFDPEGLRRTVRAGYDDIARTYDERRTHSGEGTRLVEAFGAALPESPTVLDAGCGAGVPVAATLSAVGTVVGLDLSRGMLERARTNVPATRLVQGGMTQLPLADGSVDGVVASHSVIHVPRADHGAVFEEFARVLRPGGRLLVVLGTADWEGHNEDWLDAGVEMAWSISGPEEDRRLLDAAGFERLEEHRIDDELGGAFRHVTARLRN